MYISALNIDPPLRSEFPESFTFDQKRALETVYYLRLTVTEGTG